jgi:hypothetical protein
MALPRSRFTVRRMMIAVAITGLALGGFDWISRGACMTGDIKNATGSTIFDVRVTYAGGTRQLGDLSTGITHRMGRFAETWTDITMSYRDASGKQFTAGSRIGVDLGRPIESDGDSGQAVVEIRPIGLTSERRYWISW